MTKVDSPSRPAFEFAVPLNEDKWLQGSKIESTECIREAIPDQPG